MVQNDFVNFDPPFNTAEPNGTNMIYVDPEHDLVAVVRWIDTAAMDEFVKRLLAAVEGS